MTRMPSERAGDCRKSGDGSPWDSWIWIQILSHWTWSRRTSIENPLHMHELKAPNRTTGAWMILGKKQQTSCSWIRGADICTGDRIVSDGNVRPSVPVGDPHDPQGGNQHHSQVAIIRLCVFNPCLNQNQLTRNIIVFVLQELWSLDGNWGSCTPACLREILPFCNQGPSGKGQIECLCLARPIEHCHAAFRRAQQQCQKGPRIQPCLDSQPVDWSFLTRPLIPRSMQANSYHFHCLLALRMLHNCCNIRSGIFWFDYRLEQEHDNP